MTRSITQDPRLNQSQSIASDSKPLIPQRITVSITHMIGLEHQCFPLLFISVD